MNVKLTISERIKDLRVKRKLTLVQLSNETGLSKSTLQRYESDDDKFISSFGIISLSRFYGVSSDYLLGLKEE